MRETTKKIEETRRAGEYLKKKREESRDVVLVVVILGVALVIGILTVTHLF